MSINIPVSSKPRVVIIGGGFGGLALAKALRNRPLQVILIDKNNYHTFQPLLYQVATAGLEPASIAYPLRRIFQHTSNCLFRVAEVQRVDPGRNELSTSIGNIAYDHLIIATGSQTNFFQFGPARSALMPLKSVPEALDLRSYLLQNFEEALLTNDLGKRSELMTIVIIGAGPTGVELAGALGEMKKYVFPRDYPELDLRKMEIHLFEAGSCVLPSLSPGSSAKALGYLKRLDINVWLNIRAEQYDAGGITFSNGHTIRARTVIWTAGVKGAGIKGMAESNIMSGERIRVDLFSRVKGYTNIFAIGDTAGMISAEYPSGHPMLAPVAIQQGKHLAKNLLRLAEGHEMRPFHYSDKGTMATIGRNKAVAELFYYRFHGTFAWLLWMFIHIASLVGFRSKLIVFIDWTWNYFTYDRSLRMIIRPFRKNPS